MRSLQGLKNVIQIFLVTVLTGALLTGCSSLTGSMLEKPQVELKAVNLRNITAQGTTVVFVLNLKNPNSRELPLDGLNYSVDLAGKHFAEGAIAETVVLPARDENQVEVPLDVTYAKVFSGLAQMLEGRSLDYALRGQAKFSVFSIPFEKKGALKLIE